MYLKIFNDTTLVHILRIDSVILGATCNNPDIYYTEHSKNIFFRRTEYDKHYEEIEMMTLGFSYGDDDDVFKFLLLKISYFNSPKFLYTIGLPLLSVPLTPYGYKFRRSCSCILLPNTMDVTFLFLFSYI